jgi:hypothetical protein
LGGPEDSLGGDVRGRRGDGPAEGFLRYIDPGFLGLGAAAVSNEERMQRCPLMSIILFICRGHMCVLVNIVNTTTRFLLKSTKDFKISEIKIHKGYI